MWVFKRKPAHRPVIAGCRPKGDWARASHPEPLVGTDVLQDEVRAFARAARSAEARGQRYALTLSVGTDPDGSASGVRIHGVVASGGYLGARERSWPLGSVAADLAARLVRDYVEPGVPLAAELVSLDDASALGPLVVVALLVPGAQAPAIAPQPRGGARLTLVR